MLRLQTPEVQHWCDQPKYTTNSRTLTSCLNPKNNFLQLKHTHTHNVKVGNMAKVISLRMESQWQQNNMRTTFKTPHATVIYHNTYDSSSCYSKRESPAEKTKAKSTGLNIFYFSFLLYFMRRKLRPSNTVDTKRRPSIRRYREDERRSNLQDQANYRKYNKQLNAEQILMSLRIV